MLVNRLSPKAAQELLEVQALIASITLGQQPDMRTSKFTIDRRLDSDRLYRSSTHYGNHSKIYGFVWKSHAPPCVKFFGWLLLKERVRCKINLHKKHVMDSDTCELCGQAPECYDHLIFQCTVARAFWNQPG